MTAPISQQVRHINRLLSIEMLMACLIAAREWVLNEKQRLYAGKRTSVYGISESTAALPIIGMP